LTGKKINELLIKKNWKKRGLSELKIEDRTVGEKWTIDMKQLNMKEISEY